MVSPSVAFVDTAADQLTYTNTAALIPALATKHVSCVGLRVLGASHQVKVGRLIETLACQPGRRPYLPPEHQQDGYSFSSNVETMSRRKLIARVHGLKAMADDRNALLVAFAGDPLALTAMRASDSGGSIEWETWHVYPQAGQIVSTRSTVQTLESPTFYPPETPDNNEN
jgi:hypothetical protein